MLRVSGKGKSALQRWPVRGRWSAARRQRRRTSGGLADVVVGARRLASQTQRLRRVLHRSSQIKSRLLASPKLPTSSLGRAGGAHAAPRGRAKPTAGLWETTAVRLPPSGHEHIQPPTAVLRQPGDNQAAIASAYNPENHGKLKHVERRHFFIREAIEDAKICVPFVRSDENLADYFTKPLAPKRFFELRDSEPPSPKHERARHERSPHTRRAPPESHGLSTCIFHRCPIKRDTFLSIHVSDSTTSRG